LVLASYATLGLWWNAGCTVSRRVYGPCGLLLVARATTELVPHEPSGQPLRNSA
jgi:hypothetical protein